MTPNEAADAHRTLAQTWSTVSPDAAYDRLTAYTVDELRYMLMMHVGATVQGR